MSIHQARHFVRGHYEGENAFDGHIAHNEPAIGLATDYFWHSGYRSGQAVNLKIQAHKIGHDVYLGLRKRVQERAQCKNPADSNHQSYYEQGKQASNGTSPAAGSFTGCGKRSRAHGLPSARHSAWQGRCGPVWLKGRLSWLVVWRLWLVIHRWLGG